MSGKNINDLPPEMIIRILQFLDMRSLKNATLTCKLWNNLTVSDCRWSLELSWHGEEEKRNFILTTDRKFGSIHIAKGQHIADPRIHEIFDKHGVNVIELILSGYINYLGAFAHLLTLTPNLKSAIVRTDLPAVGDLNPAQVLPDLKNLESLYMFVSDPRFIKCFRKAKLKTMEIEECGDSVVSNYDLLVDFLSAQDMLTSLTVQNFWSPKSILVEMGKRDVPIPLRLSKLAIHISDGVISSHDNDNLLKFFKPLAKNLKHLEIGDGMPSTVYESVFASTTLDTLSVSICKIPQDENIYARLKKNHSVRTIELRRDSPIDNVQFLRNFFKTFPNTRSLTLSKIDVDVSNDILVLAQGLRKLESLSLYEVDYSSFGCVRFRNLKILHIKRLCDKMDWNEFTRVHSLLTELTIEKLLMYVFLNNDDIHNIFFNVVLQSLRLGNGFVADDRFFGLIRINLKHLRELHLHKSCIERGVRDNMKIKGLELCDTITSSKFFRSTMLDLD